jgi:hypothetical protein
MQFKLFTVLTLATSVLAGAAEIKAAIESIDQKTVELGDTVEEFSSGIIGGLIDLLPLTSKSNELLKEIEAATETAEASEPLTFEETLSIASSAGKLANDVEDTLNTVIAAKPKFDKYLIVSPILRGMLKKQRAATEEFSDAFTEKVPVELKPITEALTQQIDANFAKAIAAYS